MNPEDRFFKEHRTFNQAGENHGPKGHHPSIQPILSGWKQIAVKFVGLCGRDGHDFKLTIIAPR
jgi:hypothetical protein